MIWYQPLVPSLGPVPEVPRGPTWGNGINPWTWLGNGFLL